jgi:site-specific DNA-methyltransferase (adenine-specific)
MRTFLNKIICGDCIELLGGAGEPFADLIFADPPFNIGYKYDKYHDEVEKDRYLAWTREWMGACRKVLKPAGSFYIAIGDDYAANIKLIATDELGLTMRNWIIWHYTFGQQTKIRFARAHTHIFYFVVDAKNFTFNDHAVRVPSDRQLLYNDRRANPKGKLPDDVWTEFSRVCGTFKERRGWHPCQMPENLLKRIIATSSNRGELVLDPFSGSGTTAAAAVQLERNYCGIDISEQYCANARERLGQIRRKAQRKHNLVLTEEEFGELERLLPDMERPAKQIIADKDLLGLFASQFTVRMNNGRTYGPEDVLPALMEFAY